MVTTRLRVTLEAERGLTEGEPEDYTLLLNAMSALGMQASPGKRFVQLLSAQQLADGAFPAYAGATGPEPQTTLDAIRVLRLAGRHIKLGLS